MKQKIKPILILMIILFILPISFGATFQKNVPSTLEEPGIIQVQIEIQTEGRAKVELAEMIPSGNYIIDWTSDFPTELELQEGRYEYFGEVNVYHWKFEEVNQETITISYEVEIKEYGNFETTTILIHEEGFSTEEYITSVGEENFLDVFMSSIRTQLRKPIYQLMILLIATGIMISGVYYRFFKKQEKNKKKKKIKKKNKKQKIKKTRRKKSKK